MTRRIRNRLLVAGTAGAFVVAAWISGTLLGLEGTNRWILRGSMWALGAASAFLVHLLLRRSEPDAPEPRETEGQKIDEAFAEARRKLAASGVDGGRISRLPVVLVCGPPSSTKTTLVERSGIEVELLAGDVYRGEAVVPTESVNIWYGEGTVFVEAAGALLDSDGAWRSLVRHLRPERLGAALGRGRQAPRVTLACFPCEEFVEAGGSETVPASARELRERLKELCETLGIRMPVYVTFTKADRLPHFEDFVRNLTREEAREVLGVTLPLSRHGGGGAYAEREAALLGARFDELFHSLSRRRLELLRRESDADASARLYELPREFRKARDLVVRFLVELGRPSQLGVSPLVRGFYFTGVRPIVLEEGSAPVPAASAEGGQAAVGATMVFDRADLEAARAAAPPSSGGARRVPEWVFLPRVLRRIVLEDRAGRALTGGGTQVNFLRRALAGTALGLAVLLLVAIGVSLLRNRALQADVRAAVERVARLPEPEAPAAGALSEAGLRSQLLAMEPLRGVLERLRGYEAEGPPWSLRWGLYQGAALLPPAREAYFRRFLPVLAAPARGRLDGFLGGLPNPPDGSVEYDRAYDALKAYLIVTRHPERSTEEFLAPTLTEFRLAPLAGGRGAAGPSGPAGGAGGSTPEGAAGVVPTDSLTERHYALYARELRIDDPYDMAAAEQLVADARRYLQEASGVDRFYATMIDKAEARGGPIRFADPGGVVAAGQEVSGAFTREGWRFIQTNLDEDVESLLARDDWSWVVGEARPYAGNPRELADSLRSRYERDYVDRWQAFLASASVRGFGSPAQAARSLGVLSESRSPLLRLLALASWHTAVDTATAGADVIRAAFAPVQAVVLPDTTRFVAGPNEPYVGALSGLQQQMEELAEASGPEKESVAERVDDGAGTVRSEAGSLERQFPTSGRAVAVGRLVKGLLEAPARGAERLARVAPVADLNGAGRRFCAGFGGLLTRYPFDPDARQEAEVDALSAMLQPGEGLLWKFYDERLSDLLTRQGNPASMEATRRLTPEFREFFGRAARISDALFRDGRARVDFILRMETFEGLPEVTVNIDGREQTFSRTRFPTGSFSWIADQARSARITGNVGGGEETLLNHQGPWAVFKLLGQARWEALSNTRYRLHWEESGVPLQGELQFQVEAPILNPAYLDQLDCVSRITR